MAIGVTADELDQMRAALAAEGYVWFTPLDGGPRRLVKAMSAPADGEGSITFYPVNGDEPVILKGRLSEAETDSVAPFAAEIRRLRIDVNALREAERRREAAARDEADVLEGAARGRFPLGTLGEAGPEAVMPLTTDQEGRLGVREP